MERFFLSKSFKCNSLFARRFTTADKYTQISRAEGIPLGGFRGWI